MQSKYERLPFLPKTILQAVSPGITLLQPLSRRGVGPGIVVLVPETGVSSSSDLRIEDGLPSPSMKWAEEGYMVIEITEAALAALPDALDRALRALQKADSTVPKGVVGLVGKRTHHRHRAVPFAATTCDLRRRDLLTHKVSIYPSHMEPSGESIITALECSCSVDIHRGWR